MSDYKFLGIALVGITALFVLRQWKSDLHLLLRLGVTLTLGILAVKTGASLFSALQSSLFSEALSEKTTLLCKAIGIALLTEFCGNFCRESGEESIACSVELCGKLEILLLALPFVSEILESAEKLLSSGGIL